MSKSFSPVIQSSVKRIEYFFLDEKYHVRIVWYERDPILIEMGIIETRSPYYIFDEQAFNEFKEGIEKSVEYRKVHKELMEK